MSLFEQKSLLAKLMATENLSIRQGKVPTASFDVLNRVLTVPVLDNNISKDVYDLFMGHECGHALWTPLDEMKKAKEDKINMAVLNIVEDSRIERKIKTRYPGIKTPFINAYTILFNDNFFETEGKDLNKYNFIDRVNLHCKIGASLALNFTEDERKLLDEVESTETYAEVIEVTKKICEFMKDQLEEEQEEQQTIKVAVITDGDGSEGEETSEDSEENLEDYDVVIDARDEKSSEDKESDASEEGEEQGDKGDSTSTGPEAGIGLKPVGDLIRSLTDEAYRRNEKNLFSDDGDSYVYANIPKFDINHIIDYKRMLRMMKSDNFSVDPSFVKKFNAYKRESSKVVSYLVKEFELRKNAEQMKRASTAKTGDLNMSRLYSYNFTDDIFKKMTVVPQGKSHGLVMFLDWSGSMVNHLENTVKQLLNLVLFCKKVNIPYDVYCFVDGTVQARSNITQTKEGDLVLSDFGLINLLSSRMTASDFTQCASALLQYASKRSGTRMPKFMYMGGTPLNESVIAALEIVPEFQKRNRLQIVNTVFLTDGEGSFLGHIRGHGNITRYTTHVVLRDPVTRHEETFSVKDHINVKQTDCLVRLLKARTKSHVIGFFVGSTRDITARMEIFFPGYYEKDYKAREDFAEEIKTKFKKTNCLVVTTTGFDDYYVLRSSGLDTDDTDLAQELDEAVTTRGIVSAFSKYNSSKVSSRVVLNRFIELIA